MLGSIKQVFITLLSFSRSLARMVIMSDHLSLSNKPCMTRPTFVDLNPDKCNQELRYYPFMVSLDRCNGNFNTLDDPSARSCVQNKIENGNLFLIG